MGNSVTRVEHFGHTVFHVRVGDRGVLVDPMLTRAPGTFRSPETADWFVPGGGRFDAVVISHAHDDHLHPPTLLGLAADLPVFAYGEVCIAKLRALGLRNVRPLVDGSMVEVAPGIEVMAIPAEPSVEGTQQCALLLQTADAIVLDAVDIHDSLATREALGPYRGRLDAAFVPAAGSLQWQGSHNQMDPVDAAAFVGWLDPGVVCPCGGVLSAPAPRRLGTLERYPYDRSDWFAACARELPPERLCTLPVPLFLEFTQHELTARSTTRAPRGNGVRAAMKVQALVASYFAGYHPTAPSRRISFGRDDVPGLVQAWHPYREAIATAADQVELLLRRCEPSVCRTATATWLPATVRQLLRTEQWSSASRVVATIPPPIEPDEHLAAAMVAQVEATLRRHLPHDLLSDALFCLAFDHDMLALHREHRQLRQLSRMPAATATAARAAHTDRLRDRAAARRPRLAPNHVLVETRDVPLVDDAGTDGELKRPSGPILYVASPEGVERIVLDDLQRLILERCDGRTIADITRDLGQGLGVDFPNLEHAVFSALTELSARSIQILEWGLG